VSGPVRAVYVPNGRGGTVTPIAAATGVPGPPIPIGRTAGDIAITPDGKTAYVSDWKAGTVTPIATATNTAGPPIQVGDRPYGIAILP
jgi:YVTN family beta-propeller protein